MFLKIFLKEMRDSFRDRRTLLLTVVLPIVMMTGLTFFYEMLVSEGEDETYTLAVEKSFGREEAKLFTGLENVEIEKSTDPEKMLEDGKADAALILGGNFLVNVEQGKDSSVKIIGDSFSQDASNLMTMVKGALSVYEKMVIAERLQAQGTDPKIIQPFTIEHQDITEEGTGANLLAMLIPLVLAMAIGIGASPGAADLFAGEKEKKTMEALLMTPVKREKLLLAKWLTITTIGAITGVVTLIVVAVEIHFMTENLKKAVSLGDQAYLIIGIGFLIAIIYAMFVASCLMLASIIGKTVKEAQSYSTPILMIVMFPLMIITSVGINELSFKHFVTPILNIFSILKELLFGIVNYEHLAITFASNLLCIVVIFIISRILFLKDKWVMN